jgi:hypothetical protein
MKKMSLVVILKEYGAKTKRDSDSASETGFEIVLKVPRAVRQ